MEKTPLYHLAILEKICESSAWITLTDDGDGKMTAMYIYTAGIYDTWIKGSPFEKKLAEKIWQLWQEELDYRMKMAYSKTKHQENRLEAKDFYYKWCDDMKKKFEDHAGLLRAIHQLYFSIDNRIMV